MEPLAGAGLSCIINWGNSQFHANLSFNHQTTEHICNGFTALYLAIILLETDLNMKIEMKKLFKIILCTINYHCGHISADYDCGSNMVGKEEKV